ncbi:hypothetical protein Pcinc_016571 [Petrolisthes cinctipes]|uniref:Uncharacterized protein n=1 Tax=Petrolisthes cinctipes TaxID=88211 RepID=A0AAE1FQP4_PETCI|nr:hypothetical protein Pcinc_016571 [Petrolisthes cinctipes]
MLGDYIPASPPAYSALYSNSFEGQGHHGGSAILVHRDIPCTSLELDTPLQAVAVKVFMDRPYTICSLYLPPSVTVERGDLNRLVRGPSFSLYFIGWKLEKAKWQFFRELTSSVSSVADFGSSDEAVTYFADMLHTAALNSIPRTSGYFPKRPVPWWSPVCTTAVREKRAAFSCLRHNRGDPTLLEDFRRARARARRVLKEA